MDDSRPTYFEINSFKMSCLDLTLASPALARDREWNVLGNNSVGSNHFPVLSQFVRSLIMDPGDRVVRSDYVQAKWDKFEEGTVVGLGEVNSTGSGDEYNDSLIEMM